MFIVSFSNSHLRLSLRGEKASTNIVCLKAAKEICLTKSCVLIRYNDSSEFNRPVGVITLLCIKMRSHGWDGILFSLGQWRVRWNVCTCKLNYWANSSKSRTLCRCKADENEILVKTKLWRCKVSSNVDYILKTSQTARYRTVPLGVGKRAFVSISLRLKFRAKIKFLYFAVNSFNFYFCWNWFMTVIPHPECNDEFLRGGKQFALECCASWW